MGASYGSIHFRTAGRERIRAAVVSLPAKADLRVYAWYELLSSPRKTPPPRFAVEAETMTDEANSSIRQAYTYAVCFDKPAEHVLFCGLEGKVRALDLATGSKSRSPAPPPNSVRCPASSSSSDDSLLALAYKPAYFERSPKFDFRT